MKRMAAPVVLLFCILSACAVSSDSTVTVPEILAPESEMTITSDIVQTGLVSDDADPLYNITPDWITEHSDFMIFKYGTSTQSFIQYEDEVYDIGSCFGGYGIISMALADLNRDGQYELYYTFSWGSGLHRSQVGYFDPASKEVTIFEDAFWNSDLMLTVNQAGDLCVNAAVLDMDSFVDFSVKAQEQRGIVAFEDGQIILKNTN